MRWIMELAMMVAAPAGTADGIDWQKKADRLLLDKALNSTAQFCVGGFGFTQVARKPPDAMADKIHAHLLLSSSPTNQVDEWVRYMEGMTKLDKDNEALEERMADALIAAATDPASYARAETLYVNTIVGRIDRSLATCREGAKSDFTREHYWTGEGSSDRYAQEAKKNFVVEVEKIRVEKIRAEEIARRK